MTTPDHVSGRRRPPARPPARVMAATGGPRAALDRLPEARAPRSEVTSTDPSAGVSTGLSVRRLLSDLHASGLRTRPFPYPPATAGAAMALLYLAGGLTALLIVLMPHPMTLNIPIILTVGAATPVLAAAVWLRRHRLPARAYPWLLALGSAVITLLVAVSGSHSALVSTSFFYTWVVIYAVVFFTRLDAFLQIAGAATAYALVLTSAGSTGRSEITALEPIALSSVIATTGLIVTVLSKARETGQTDPLTRVANRRGLDALLSRAMTGAAGGDRSLVVAMIDVDHFKAINDRGGHTTGDRVLEELSGAWRRVLRTGDGLARYGGDEFVAIVRDCSHDDAARILERLRSATPPGVTCSLGAATWRPGDSASMLLSSADAALYRAKRLGRDRVVWAADE